MTFEVTILGCGAATPSGRHNPSAQMVNVHDKLFLVDCGEGTQMQMRKYRLRFQRVNHIFISHLHGDHFFGLPGLISTFSLLGRQSKLHIYGPPALKEIIDVTFQHSETYLEFALEFHPVSDKKKMLLMEDETLEVYSIPLKHRIPCTGFLFVEKQKPLKIKKEKISEYRLTPLQIIELKKGNDVMSAAGQPLLAAEMCMPREKARSYAYCSDTMYWEKLAADIFQVNLLYHEATFLTTEEERAKKTFHSTALQAAKLATIAETKQLLLGHFSSRYTHQHHFLDEALTAHANVLLADEGLTFQVG
ncbi:MAG: ribonuclease Z [Crocinitomicaceae bacterium]|nr:ribonuclease Z [Crocinitomicaceae bacterium]